LAVLADIHGNLPALEAVLADVAAAGADRIVLNGDIADGPFPGETLRLLAELGPDTVWLRGNGDRWLAEGVRHADPATDRLLAWVAAGLTAAERAMLGALPLLHTQDVPGLGRVGICHATPRSDNEMLLVDSGFTQVREAFAGCDATTVVVGHSHMPFDRLFAGRRVVNAGSVGMAYGHAGAAWALVGPDIVLRRTGYDSEAAASRILATDMPDADDFVRSYIRAQPSDAEAMGAFRKTLRRQQQTGQFA
jgi:predicted phosphodiesterase